VLLPTVRQRIVLAVALLQVCASGCAPVSSQACEPLDDATRVTVSAAPSNVGGATMTVQARTVRDATPRLFPSSAHGIAISIRLGAIDPSALPDIAPTCVRIQRAADAWQTRLTLGPEARGTDALGRETLLASAGNGPYWDPGTPVQVIAWLRISGRLVAFDFGELTITSVS
jgi:hypothetical protein